MKPILTKLLPLGIAFALGATTVVLGPQLLPEPTVDLTDIRRWTLLHTFGGELAPGDGVEAVTVYSARIRPRSSWFGEFILQTRIDVRRGSEVQTFVWPTPEFAASWCDVIDLDGDGNKEIVVMAGDVAARVVQYRHGRFEFRDSGKDEVVAEGLQLTPLGPEGRLAFTFSETMQPDGRLIPRGAQALRVKVWSASRGFEEASK